LKQLLIDYFVSLFNHYNQSSCNLSIRTPSLLNDIRRRNNWYCK